MPDAQLERADGGLLRTDADPEDGDEDGPYRVWAQIFEPGDVTRGGDGTNDGGGERREDAAHWTESALREGIEGFGPSEHFQKHFVEGHPLDPSISDILGEALDATFDDELGVVLEGEVDSRDTARLIDRGRVGISPWIYRTLGDYNEAKDAYDVEQVLGVRDYGIVRNGENQSADINLGESPLARAEADADSAPTAEALAATFEPDGAERGREEADARARAANGTNNAGSGQVSETMSDPDDTPDDTDPDGAGTSGTDTDAEALRERIDALESENEQLRSELDENRAEKIEELRERIGALEDENESMSEDLEPVEGQAVEAMSRHTNLPEDMVREKYDLQEMAGVLTGDGDDEPDTLAEALSWDPDPNTGDPDPTGGTGGGGGGGAGGLDSLSSDERSEVEALAKRAETFDSVDGDHAETLRAKAAEKAGVEEFDALDLEVV